MRQKNFKAMVVTEVENDRFVRNIEDRHLDDLPKGDVLVNVEYSSLNYKDVLSAIGNRGVTKNYPHTPGIDAAGRVVESLSKDFKAGDAVIVTSYDLGMNTSGGFGQYIRVPAEWVVKMPEDLSARESMIFGTAGFTAALSVFRLVDYGITPDMGRVVVSGATGGVGSIAVSILSKAGYEVTAVNGVVDEKDFLLKIGAKEVISIEEAIDSSGRPMLKGLWAGGIDTVGGEILATTIKSTKDDGAVTCCGNVGSHDLPLNVYPFILRGVTLMGIDSQNCPMPMRLKVWNKIADEWKLDHLELLTTEVPLEGLDQRIDLILQRKHKGRTIVKLPD
ncbi:MAG: YhdH/YhfP family quinone oxidoreductase [Deltaproteobacteria bacterium]|jgi:acrylyl-CoA reductase (NADPH)|nr:YhdH/YhfP family quinone oxidoreductase [Deltaproteobacteria bacterium]MDX2498120.1 YhdH/YhfP family quinone oxidoreductase [Desulfobacterales bacterium]MBW1746992.1 YhdH/YhfP family quinone oxidoreductase [Deltaproteobacteria bacterium]MBW1825639.1 YhdH/YhfP family quinone oxidoreductase [Deltaproteobacteria bacterium]MBW2155700.1 YhdH/YhfP family quinone oxidoreductase [Deltaproteobacteria bacterium]